MSKKLLFFSFVFSAMFFRAQGALPVSQSSGLSFRDIPVAEGLSQSSVYCMLQDHKNFIWIGTKDGLNRYDGYEFISYKYDQTDPNSLSNNEITCLENDNNKYLWIGTRSGGINKLNFATGNIVRFNNLTYDDLIQDIVIDSLNYLWAATSEGLLMFPPNDDDERNMIRNVSETARYFNHNGRIIEADKKNISISSIAEIREGYLLIGCEEGLFEYNIEKNEFKSISSQTLGITVFTDLIVDEEKTIWAASYEGLFRIKLQDNDDSNLEIVHFNSNASADQRLSVDWVESLTMDHKNRIWAGTRGGGLFRIEGQDITGFYQHNPAVKTSVPDDLINSLIIDRTGILWIGTESKGLAYTDLYAKSFDIIGSERGIRNSLSDNLVTAISGNDSRLWVGTAAAGIDVFERNNGFISKSYNIPRVLIGNEQSTREVMALLCDDDNDLWIGSATNRLTVYNQNDGFSSYVVNGFVFSLFQDNKGRIWFGTWGQGLGYIDKSSRQIESYHGTVAASLGLSNDKVLCIFQDSNDLLWVGTKGGGINVCPVNEVVNRTGEFISYRNIAGDSSSLSYNDVYDIHEDSQGNIWIATGSGLNKVVSDEASEFVGTVKESKISFDSYYEKDGLAGGLVLFIEEDIHGDLWMGTNKGISRLNPDAKVFTNYGANDGLPSGEFHLNASFSDADSRMMYFGGVDGMAVFHPDSLRANPFPAKVQITGLRLHNRPVYPGDKINGKIILDKHVTYADHLTLSHSNNEITLEFSALHFSNPDKTKYAFRLRGFNDSWQETTSENRRATYTNLHEGDYTFEVRGTNNDGTWSSDAAEIPITVNPPVWRTYWAYSFYFALLIFLLLAFRKYSLIGVKKKNSLIVESLEHKKERELAEAKMRFFTNISHEIRTPLTLIYAPLQEVLKRNDIQTDIHDTLSVMYRNVRRLLNMVNQLLEFRKIDTGHSRVLPVKFNLNELCKDTLTAFNTMADQKDIKTTMTAPDRLFVIADEKMISTAIYNLLSNALKFTPPGGEVSVHLEDGKLSESHGKEHVILRVCDSGPGIPEDRLNHIFDRFTQVTDDHQHLGGSGIGLSIVKEFVELNHGTVKAYNRSEGGSCFEIILKDNLIVPDSDEEIWDKTNEVHMDPLIYSDVLPDSSSFSDDAMEADSLGNGSDKPALCIIEDDRELAFWLRKVFEKQYRVFLFHDGREALLKIPSVMPDIIICDIMLPGLSGIELSYEFKSKIETSHIPIIMLTAKSGEDSMLEGLQTGADSYLTKPFNIDILKAQVNSLVGLRKAFRQKFSGKMSLEPSEETITPVDEKFLSKLLEVTEEKMKDPGFDVSVLVNDMHMSHSIILKKVKALTGLSLVEFIRSMRVKRAAQIFRQDKLSVSEVSFMVGFSDPKYFSKCFSRQMGKKPTQYIKDYHV